MKFKIYKYTYNIWLYDKFDFCDKKYSDTKNAKNVRNARNAKI